MNLFRIVAELPNGKTTDDPEYIGPAHGCLFGATAVWSALQSLEAARPEAHEGVMYRCVRLTKAQAAEAFEAGCTLITKETLP